MIFNNCSLLTFSNYNGQKLYVDSEVIREVFFLCPQKFFLAYKEIL